MWVHLLLQMRKIVSQFSFLEEMEPISKNASATVTNNNLSPENECVLTGWKGGGRGDHLIYWFLYFFVFIVRATNMASATQILFTCCCAELGVCKVL